MRQRATSQQAAIDENQSSAQVGRALLQFQVGEDRGRIDCRSSQPIADHVHTKRSIHESNGKRSVCESAHTKTSIIQFNAFTRAHKSVVEKVVYTPSAEHPGKTLAVRSAWIDSQVFGFSRAIRAFGVERFKKNCNKMVSIYRYLQWLTIQELFQQVFGFNHVLNLMYAAPSTQQHSATTTSADSTTYLNKANTKFKEAAKTASVQVKVQAEHIYQAYSVNNWDLADDTTSSLIPSSMPTAANGTDWILSFGLWTHNSEPMRISN